MGRTRHGRARTADGLPTAEVSYWGITPCRPVVKAPPTASATRERTPIVTASGPKNARRSFCGRNNRRYSLVWCRRDAFLPESIMLFRFFCSRSFLFFRWVFFHRSSMSEALLRAPRQLAKAVAASARNMWAERHAPQLALAGVQQQELLLHEPAHSKSPLGQVRRLRWRSAWEHGRVATRAAAMSLQAPDSLSNIWMGPSSHCVLASLESHPRSIPSYSSSTAYTA